MAKIRRQLWLSLPFTVIFLGLLLSFGNAWREGYQQSLENELITPGRKCRPVLLRGLRIYPDNPFKFEFIFDQGDAEVTPEQKQAESLKLIDYFLTALAIPSEELWVNLSPHEKERIISAELGRTNMGEVMLQSDLVLKRFISSLTYPETDLGKKFWERVYQKAYAQFSTTRIPVNTFNKIWVVPKQALVYEDGDSAYISESRLKVLLEEDYLALKHQQDLKVSNRIASQIMREVILPVIDEEVNSGEHFTSLRQIYHSFILAVWFKRQLKQSVLNHYYADQKKIKGISAAGPKAKEEIFKKYLENYRRGIYDYVKREFDPASHSYIKRRYYSGGLAYFSATMDLKVEKRRTARPVKGWSAVSTLSPIVNIDESPVLQPATQVRARPMKEMRVLLIQPRSTRQKDQPTRWPAGLMALAAMVTDKESLQGYCALLGKPEFILADTADYPDVEVSVLDLRAEAEDFDFAGYVREYRPDLVGIGAMTPDIIRAEQLAGMVKAINKEIFTVVGGNHLSSIPRETMENSNFDLGIIGEGEEVFSELIMQIATGYRNFSSMDGVILKDQQPFTRRRPVMKLDHYPTWAKAIPLLHNRERYQKITDLKGKYLGEMGVLSIMRGCPGNCSMCSARLVFPGGYRYLRFRSAPAVAQELKFISETYGINSFYGLDDTFTANKELLQELAEAFKEQGVDITFSANTRADFIDAEVADSLKAMGCKLISLGVEVGDQFISDRVVRKGTNLDQVERASKILSSRGILVKWFLMVGLPDQNWLSILKTADFILKNKDYIADIGVSTAVPYPNTALASDQKIEVIANTPWSDYHYEPEPSRKKIDFPEAIINTNVMTAREIGRARYLLIKIFEYRNHPQKMNPLLTELRQRAGSQGKSVSSSASVLSQDPAGGFNFNAQYLEMITHKITPGEPLGKRINFRNSGWGIEVTQWQGVKVIINYIKPLD